MQHGPHVILRSAWKGCSANFSLTEVLGSSRSQQPERSQKARDPYPFLCSWVLFCSMAHNPSLDSARMQSLANLGATQETPGDSEPPTKQPERDAFRKRKPSTQGPALGQARS